MVLEALNFTAGVTLPIFVMMFLGLVLRRFQIIDDPFMDTASRLVVNFGLPAVLFLGTVRMDLGLALDRQLIAFTVAMTIASVGILWLLAGRIASVALDRGVFVQGAFRGNLAITGLALVANMYGQEGVSIASLLMAFLVPLYNVLSVLVLVGAQRGHEDEPSLQWTRLARNLFGNPLIVAIAVGLVINRLALPLPSVLVRVGEYFSSITLPLALLCIGGTLSLRALREASCLSLWATVAKVLILPALMVVGAIWLGYRGTLLGVVFLLSASPTAVASYVMARSMGGNAQLAASIVVLTTLMSMVTVSVGIFVLRFLHYL
ncbi:MAG: hypothetical protein B0D91_14685 [Oceanospirillales bacterium LUC14_002_19_P2]|nr:MAG: hypothetical protein B0D91_14685 [Oceanospirillales bacterium LUC14_002_19_P2]